MSSWFKLHVIPSRKPLDWACPRNLLKCTLFNHLVQDLAPIGHFFVEIESDQPNRYGVKRVVSGMSRENKNQSTIAVIKEGVGLGSFFYDFKGALDSSEDAVHELEWAKKRKRLKTITVPVSSETAAVLMDEMDQWIRNASFRHYSGGLEILKGQGSGCAEFGAHFFNLALGSMATPKEWIRSVYAAKKLTGGQRTGKKVSIFRVFLQGTAWAKDPVDGFLYATPDMDLTWSWMEKRAPGAVEMTLEPKDITWNQGEKFSRISFEAGYSKESEEEVRKQWRKISL